MNDFRNEPLLELRRSSERDQLVAALDVVDATLPIRVPVILRGERRDGTGFESVDPGDPDRVVALAAGATSDEAATAVEAAREAGVAWGRQPARDRANVLFRAAGELRRRRYELAALAVRECAKPWPEADADVCEAIDFLEYYASGAIELESGPELVQLPGERNTLQHRPRAWPR